MQNMSHRTIPSAFVPNSDIIFREVGDAFVLYDPNKDALHTLNATAQLVWEHIQSPIETIIAKLLSTYQVSPEVAQRDVIQTLEQFLTLGLIQNKSPQ
jgi:PqqD family protein of HPr-rel-A system